MTHLVKVLYPGQTMDQALDVHLDHDLEGSTIEHLLEENGVLGFEMQDGFSSEEEKIITFNSNQHTVEEIEAILNLK